MYSFLCLAAPPGDYTFALIRDDIEHGAYRNSEGEIKILSYDSPFFANEEAYFAEFQKQIDSLPHKEGGAPKLAYDVKELCREFKNSTGEDA